MVPDVAIPTYDQAYGSLGSVYDPQTQLVQSQLADLPAQEQTTLSSLDQAKANAFRDITDSANSKGLLFSGFSPEEQARYTGEKYLPAVAAAKAATTNAKYSLTGTLNDIAAKRAAQAQGIVSSATAASQKAAYQNARLSQSAAKAATKMPSQQEVSAAIRQGLTTVRGKDGYVAPQDYARAYADWTQAGFDGSQFDKYFGDLMNPKNAYYQYAKTQVR